MKNYELALILSLELNTEELNKAIQDIAAFIQEKGGLIKNQELRGKQRGGILATLAFSVNAQEIENIQKKLKENARILHFMAILAPKKRIAAAPSLSVQQAPKITMSEEPKMSAQDIDKKLEEIFKT